MGRRDELDPRMMAAPTTPAYTISAKDDKGRWEQERGYRDVELRGGPKR